MYALTTCSFKPIDHQLSQPCIIRLRMRPYNSGVLLVNGSECPLCFYRRQPAAIFVLDLSNSWPQFIERGQIATGPEQTSNSVVFKKIFGEQSQNYSQKRIFIQKVLNAPAKYVCQGDENAKTVTGVGCRHVFHQEKSPTHDSRGSFQIRHECRMVGTAHSSLSDIFMYSPM